MVSTVLSDLIKREGRSKLARRLGVSHVATYHWEKKGHLSATRARQISDVYKIPPWMLRPDLWPPPKPRQPKKAHNSEA